jgi:hypothetical protein
MSRLVECMSCMYVMHNSICDQHTIVYKYTIVRTVYHSIVCYVPAPTIGVYTMGIMVAVYLVRMAK